MAGRRPKPTAIKRAQGNPGKRKLRNDEPTATTRTTAPRVLGPVGHREWNRVVKATKELGTITKLDRGELTLYCRAWEDYVEAVSIYTRDGLIIEGRQGPKRHPAWDVAEKAAKLMHTTAMELGFTPAARSKVHSDAKPKETNFEKFLGEGGLKAAK